MAGGDSNPLVGSVKELKRRIGNLVVAANADIIELNTGYRRVKDGGELFKKEQDAEKSLIEKKAGLDEALRNLETNPDYVTTENLQKFVRMMKTTVETTEKLLAGKDASSEAIDEGVVKKVQLEAKDSVDEIEVRDEQFGRDIQELSSTLSKLTGSSNKPAVDRREESNKGDEDEQLKRELNTLDSYMQERYKKIEKEIKRKMLEQIIKLETTWDEEKDTLDYLGLKEVKFEFDQVDKKLRFLVNEWDKRKISDKLSDHLSDTLDQLFEEYHRKYTKMADQKRIEDATQRKKDKEIYRYKNEKRRAIPTWPEKIPYAKFKPDLISWNRENHLSSGATKFGEMVEMLKKEGRITTFEQIQTRLGRQRDEKDIIEKIVELLDAINEETVYNKLAKGWDSITNLKRKSGETLNDFFSRYETLHYSLNCADDSFKEPAESATVEEKMLMMNRRIELSDKLKAVLLIKSIGVDESHKRDILAKVDFNKEPNIVYESRKIAIRDICGEAEAVTNPEKKSDDQVLVVKPWEQERRNRSRSWSQSRGRARDRSGGRSWDGGRGRSRERLDRSQDRGRHDRSQDRYRHDRSQDRGHSQDRSQERRGRRSDWRQNSDNKSVSFKDKRDPTPVPGRIDYDPKKGNEVLLVNNKYDEVFVNDEDFIENERKGKQLMILDIGCPRSLSGENEYNRLLETLTPEELEHLHEYPAREQFRFGPSKVYNSSKRVEFNLTLRNVKIKCRMFILKGDIPILIGNDILEPLDGVIFTKDRILKLREIGKVVPLDKTSGGHYVIPVREKEDYEETQVDEPEEETENFLENGNDAFVNENKNNVRGFEADAVMLVLLAECSDEKDFWNLHNLMGHSNFITMILDEDEKEDVSKVHRYFGHRSGRKVWELFSKAGKLKGKKQAVLEMLEKCKTCRALKKSPPRPKIGMPIANSFNEVVAMDLKVLDKNRGYILWLVDMFTKAIKGVFIKDKNPETIVTGIIDTWILGDGFGPGHPSLAFYSDNCGEFLNNTLVNFAAKMNTTIRMTAADAPWQNGTVERHHATADVIYEKFRNENPNMSHQDALKHAAFAKNCEINQAGFSPLQLIMGKNPTFPGLAEVTPASSNVDSSSKAMKALKRIDDARVKFREYDCNEKLKKVRSQRINPSVEMNYTMGDSVLFRDDKKKEWKQGTALVRFGKTLYLKFGNWLRRVPIDKVIPDVIGAEKAEESFIDPAEAECDEERFEAEETPIEELANDIETAKENLKLKEKVQSLEQVVQEYKNGERQSNDDVEEEKNESSDDVDNTKEKVKTKRAERRRNQKLRKAENSKQLPVLGQSISFKEKDSEVWKKAKVFGVFKKSSLYKNVKQIELENGQQLEKDFEKEVDDWKPVVLDEKEDDTVETFFLSSILGKKDAEEVCDVYPVELVKKCDYGSADVQEAMQKEIEKYKQFQAIEEVLDEGQDRVPIKWVVTKHEIDGKNQPLKARLCIRGDLEKFKDNVRSDSPTAGKETLKLALLVAANEGFTVKSGDVKAAYLQGQDLQRQIFVQPPTEAGIVNGKIWKLKKAAYGVLDGGRLFYLRLVEELEKLGLHKVHADGALFCYVKDGKLQGIFASHVDDFLLMGNETFKKDVEEKLQDIFKFSKVEENAFKYCGCKITVKDGEIELDQDEYVEKLKLIEKKTGDKNRNLEAKEIKELRGQIGEVLWLSLMTRPDLAFDVNIIASEVPRATLETLKKMNKIIIKARSKKEKLRFVKLGKISDLIVKLYTDASYNNQDGLVRSTEGRVVLIENQEEQLVSVASWKTRKIPRVCRSVKSAETRALEDGIDEAVNTARVIHEIYTGEIDLKNPKQIPVHAKTDSKSLWESLNNTKQCEEKLLRNTIAGIKELIDLGMVTRVDWVPTDKQLADCLTKAGLANKSDWLLKVARSNKLQQL